MNFEDLYRHILQWSEIVNTVSSTSRVPGLGYAVLIPDDSDEEARLYVDEELIKLNWTFQRQTIFDKEYYVFFP